MVGVFVVISTGSVDVVHACACDLPRHRTIRHRVIQNAFRPFVDIRVGRGVEANQLLFITRINQVLDRRLVRVGIQIAHNENIIIACDVIQFRNKIGGILNTRALTIVTTGRFSLEMVHGEHEFLVRAVFLEGLNPQPCAVFAGAVR